MPGDQVEGGSLHPLPRISTCSMQSRMCLAFLIGTTRFTSSHCFRFTHSDALSLLQVGPNRLPTPFHWLGHSLLQTITVSIWGNISTISLFIQCRVWVTRTQTSLSWHVALDIYILSKLLWKEETMVSMSERAVNLYLLLKALCWSSIMLAPSSLFLSVP